MVDGLGLVYEKQGNTGAGAYEQPFLRLGNTPLDAEADRINQQIRVEQQNQMMLERQKERQKAEAFKPFENIELSKWDIANRQEIGQDIINTKNEIAALRGQGVVPNNYADPRARRYDELLLGMQNKIKEADSQKAIYDNALKTLQADFDNPNPVFDVEKSAAALKKFAEAPNISARRGIDPQSLLVRKPKPFDTYSPLKDFDIKPYVGSFGKETPESAQSGSTLNKVNLKKDMEALAYNPINDEHYKQGLDRGLWGSRTEYADALYKKALNQYTPTYKTETKAPKGYTRSQLNSGNTQDWLNEFGASDIEVNVPLYDAKTDKRIGTETERTVVPYSINLGNINATVPAGSVISGSTGERSDATKNYELVSGYMGIPLVYKKDNRLVPLTDGKDILYKDNKGKIVRVTGTPDEIAQQLVNAGVAEYKPMIFGNGKTGAGDNAKVEEIVVPADAIIKSTNENKALQGANAAYEVQKRFAAEKNGKTNTSGTPKKQIKRGDIATKAAAAGYTIAEYTKLLQQNNVEITD